MSTRVLVVDDSPTIRRVVGAALQRAGHDVATAADVRTLGDQLAAFIPDLLLLDHALPVDDGVSVLEQLARARGWLPPIIVMAARSDGLAGVDERLRGLGVVDVVTKPFSPEALIAVVRHCLDKQAALRRRSAADDFADDEHTVPALSPALSAGRTTVVGAPTAVDASVTGEPARPRLPAGFALVGELAQVALPELLQLLTLQAHTGVLVVDTGDLCVDVALAEGRIVGAVAVDDEGAPARRGGMRLGRYLVATGGIADARLEPGIAAATGPGLLGERLVAAGAITTEALQRAVAEQTQDFVVELLRARRGVFGLKSGASHLPATAVPPGWSVDALLFEALRRIDEWAVVEREVPSFEARFAVRGDVDSDDLSIEERDVLQGLVAGPARVRDLVARSPLLPFDVCRVLYRLAVLKRVQRLDDGDPTRLLSDERSPAEPLLSSIPRRSDA